LLRKTIRK